jgi:hypothetical protein
LAAQHGVKILLNRKGASWSYLLTKNGSVVGAGGRTLESITRYLATLDKDSTNAQE